MLFMRKSGTKVVIKLEPLAKDHIEPYTPSVINVNCTIVYYEYHPVIQELNTHIEGVPSFLLDEWGDENHEFDRYKHRIN